MAGEEKNTQPQSCSWPPRAPRAALKPQSPATPWRGGMVLCPAAARPLTSPPALRPSLLPGSEQPAGARVQQGVQTPGVLRQPEDPREAVWGPAPSSVCARACPCQLQGQRCTLAPLPASACFPISFPLPGLSGTLSAQAAMPAKKTTEHVARAGQGQAWSPGTGGSSPCRRC